MLVGELRVRDRELALQLVGRAGLLEAPSASVSMRETKKLATDATVVGSPPLGDEPLEPAHIGLRDLGVAFAGRRSA